MRALRACAVLLGVALVAGCRSGGAHKMQCPASFIAPKLDAYTVLRPGATGPGSENIAFGVRLASVKATCRSEAGGIQVTTGLVFIAARNDPEFRQGDFTYFVAIADPQQNILAKQNFGLRADFAPTQKEMRIADEITEHLPLKDTSLGGSYAVIVGLQVSPQQLDLNRQH